MPDPIKDLLLTVIGLGVLLFGGLVLDMDAQELLDHYEKRLNES